MRQRASVALLALAFVLNAPAALAEAAGDTIVAEPRGTATTLFADEARPAIAGCQDELAWLDDDPEPPPGTECCGGGLYPDGCWGYCYAEVTCPDGRYVGCYGGNSQACRVEGEYAVCDATYYSCDQCQAEQPAALGCEYC